MEADEWKAIEALRQKNLVLLHRLRLGQEKYHHHSSSSDSSSTKPDAKNVSFSMSTSNPAINHVPKERKSHLISKQRESSKGARAGYDTRSEVTAKHSSYKPVINSGQPPHQGLRSRVTKGGSDASRTSDLVGTTSTLDRGQTSTPTDSPMSKQGTPKSILKRRQMIDDNIKVDAGYDTTPNTTPSKNSHRNGLNFSYSDVDDQLAMDLAQRSSARSRLASRDSKRNETATGHSKQLHPMSVLEDEERALAKRREQLMLDAGNTRTRGRKADTDHRTKTVVFDTENSPHSTSGMASRRESPGRSLPPALDSRLQPPLLGYDWIAGSLENDEEMCELPDHLYSDIAAFRKSHQTECQSNPYTSNPLNLTRPLTPEVRDPHHTCIHGYEVSDRLFTQPVNADDDGRSVCPICMKSRQSPTPLSPGFIRVSVPRTAVGSPHHVKPHRRSSFDPTDSCALSEHCLAGWDCAPPSTLPAASTVDLKKAVKNKQTTTVEETDKLAQAYTRSARLAAYNPTTDQVPWNTGQSSQHDDVGSLQSQSLKWELRRGSKHPGSVRQK